MLLFEAGLFIFALIVAITIHEAAHCYMADYLGDPTPRSQGRTTLNPKAHLDLIGSILLPLGAMLTRSPVMFGWGRPAPYDPYNLKNPRRDTALIALAGPISNLILAILVSIVLRFLGNSPGFTSFALTLAIQVNVSLALFNLLPVPPLDGSKIISLFLSPEANYRYLRLSNKHSYLLIFLLILPLINGQSLVSLVLTPINVLLMQLLIPIL